jgi:putative nucleotidyltransferase with HDIG domain
VRESDLDHFPPLPPAAAALLAELAAPPRLVAHLTLVHAAALALADGVAAAWPSLAFDREVVRLGAAIHDVGKVVYPEELSGPGAHHEAAGEALLLAHGLPPALARFARTHGGPDRAPDATLEDWLVMLADAAWKGARPAQVEEALCQAISRATGVAPWEVYLTLDGIVGKIVAGADARLQWYASQPL